MPPVVVAIVAVLADIGITASTTAVGLFLLNIGASLVLGEVSHLLSKTPTSSSLTNNVASRSTATRQFED